MVSQGVGQGLKGIGGRAPRKYRYAPPVTLPEASGSPRRSKIMVLGSRGSGGSLQPCSLSSLSWPCLPFWAGSSYIHGRTPFFVSWLLLGLSWALLGHLGAILRPQKPIITEKARRVNTLIFIRFSRDLGFSGASLGGSLATCSRLGAVLEPHGDML